MSYNEYIMKTIIIKLGGSVITAKRSRKPRIERAVIQAIARDIVAYRKRNPGVGIVLLHGAGSFGHPLAHRHGLVHGVPTTARMVAAAKTIASMRTFGNLLCDILWKQGLPVVPVQSSAAIPFGRRNDMIVRLLQVGAIPLLNGDVVLRNGRTDIMSADEQVVELARTLRPSKIVFLTDVEGVFLRFPPTENETPPRKITRDDVRGIVRGTARTRSRTDVTGGMQGKLSELLGLRRMSVIVCSGKKPHALLRAVDGSIGTVLVL